MKYPAFILIVIFTMMSSIDTNAQSANTIDKLQWKNRVLLLFSPSYSSEKYNDQLSIWGDVTSELQERDLVIFKIVESEISGENDIKNEKMANELRSKYQVSDDQFTVVLIGKDGGEKLKQMEVLKNEKLFAIIDAMPMRRNEMK